MPSPFDINKNKLSPFDAKKIQTDSGEKSLFKRGHGVFKICAIGANEVIFAIPYAWVKITAIEIIGGEVGDDVSLSILDTELGTYTTVPNYLLNKFAFNLCIAKEFYQRISKYDADLYGGMQVRVVYNSVSAKTIGLNFDLDEVK